jgi:hypothetical protein
MQLNRKQPVNSVDLSKIPTDKRQEVLDAMLSGRSHPLLDQVARVVLTNTRGKKSTNKVGKSLSDLIKGDVIDFAGRKKQVSEPSSPASGKMSFTEIAQQNRANQQRMQQDRAARNEQTKRMYNIKPSTEALTSSPAEEKIYDAETGKERSLSEKPKRLGVDLFEGYPQSHIKNLINDYGVDGLGLTGAYEDAAMELHNENMEDQGLEYNEDTDEWLDSDGEVVDPDDHFPEEEEIMERMFDNHRHLMRDEEDPEEEKDTSKSFDKSNKIEGGKGDKSRKTDFPEKQIAEGLKVEREHTKDPKIAEEIALDHLTEDPRYYSKLKTSGLADELKKAKQAIEKLQKRCWEGYEPVPGKKPYSKGSCVKKAISAPAIEGGEYKGEKLDAHHHNRLGKEYREMARQAIAKGDKQTAAKHQAKSLFHFSRATEMGYEPPEE